MEKQWEERTKKETQTGANGSPRGVDDRHTGDLRIILCDSFKVIMSIIFLVCTCLAQLFWEQL